MHALQEGLNPDVAMTYLDFVAERHRIWERRQAGEPGPWTDDPILRERKFTCVFRILDPGTQFVLRELRCDDSRDYLMRCFLYRHTGRIEAWEYLQLALGDYPTVETLDQTLEAFKEYRGTTKLHIKSPRRPGQVGRGNGKQKLIGQRPIFTGAYLVFPQSQQPGTDKIESIVRLTQRLFDPDSPDDIMPSFLAAETQAERFAVLRRNKGVADFMSMQVLTDWGYGQPDREDEFVVAGPGARRGAAALSPADDPEHVIRWAQLAVHAEGDTSLGLPDGRVRLPSLMDIQNTLCEFSKYVRYQSKPSGQKTYQPAHPGAQLKPVLPRHW